MFRGLNLTTIHPHYPPGATLGEIKETGQICSSFLPVMAILDPLVIKEIKETKQEVMSAKDEEEDGEEREEEGLKVITWDIRDTNIFGPFFEDKEKNKERLRNVKRALDRFQSELKPDFILLQGVGVEDVSLFPNTGDYHRVVEQSLGNWVTFYNSKKFQLDRKKKQGAIQHVPTENHSLRVSFHHLDATGHRTGKQTTVYNISFKAKEEKGALVAPAPAQLQKLIKDLSLSSGPSKDHQVIFGGNFGPDILVATPGQKNLITGCVSVDGVSIPVGSQGILYLNDPKAQEIHQPKQVKTLPTGISGVEFDDVQVVPIDLSQLPYKTQEVVKFQQPCLTFPVETAQQYAGQLKELKVLSGLISERALAQFYLSVDFLNQFTFLVYMRDPVDGFLIEEQSEDLGALIQFVSARELGFAGQLLEHLEGEIINEKLENPIIRAICEEAKKLLDDKRCAYHLSALPDRPLIAVALAYTISYIQNPNDPHICDRLKAVALSTRKSNRLNLLLDLIGLLIGVGLCAFNPFGIVTGTAGWVVVIIGGAIAGMQARSLIKDCRQVSFFGKLNQEADTQSYQKSLEILPPAPPGP